MNTKQRIANHTYWSWSGWPQPRHFDPKSANAFQKLLCRIGMHPHRHDLSPVLPVKAICMRCGRQGLV